MAGCGVRSHKAKSSTEPWNRRSRVDTTGAGNREGAADHGRSAGKARGNATWTELHRNRSHAALGRAEIDRRQRRGHDSTHGRMRLSDLAADLAATEGADFRRCALFGLTGSSAAKTSRLLVERETSEERPRSGHQLRLDHEFRDSRGHSGPERLRLYPLREQGRWIGETQPAGTARRSTFRS